jgi:putative transposase
VEYLKQPGTVANFMAIKKWLIPDLPEWARETPRAIKDGAVAQACAAVRNAKRKFQVTGQFQDVRFRARKDPVQTLFIRNDMIRNGTIYPTKLGRLRMAESLPDDPRDSQLLRENGRYYLCVPYKTTVQRGDNQARIVGLDPGVRTLISFYSPEAAGKLGEYDFGRIARLCRHLDKLMSRIDTSPARRKARMRKAANRLRWKIKDLIREAHYKIGRFLVDHFEVIFLPELETARLASRTKRKLRKKSVRAMLR